MTTVEVAPPAASIRPPDPTPAVAPVTRRRRRPTWPTVAAVLFLLGYAWLGLYLLFTKDYAIGDSLARSSQARGIVDSRDPHLAAIGFVWMPLPTFAQIPLSWVLSPFGWAAASGPLSTSAFAAGTIPVLAAIGRRLRLRTGTQVTIVLVYAANPVVVFYAIAGMSEASWFFFCALFCLCYLRWYQDRRTHDLALLGLALAGGSLTRYEGYMIAGFFAVAVAAQVGRGRRISTAIFVGAPAFFVLAVWMATSHILVRNATFFLDGLRTSATPPADAPWLPRERNLVTATGYSTPLVFRMVPAIAVLIPLALADDLRARARLGARAVGPTVLLLAALTFPASVTVLLARNQAWGNPRYFAPLILFATIAAAWMMRDGSVVPRRWHGAIVIALLLGWLTGFVTMADPDVSAIEGEPYAVHALVGLGEPAPQESNVYALPRWRELVDDLDAMLQPDDLVAADTSVAFPAALFTRHPRQFVIPSDRDFEQRMAAPGDRITYVILATDPNRPGVGASVAAVLAQAPIGTQWQVVEDYRVAQLHRLVPAPGYEDDGDDAGATAQG